MLRLVVLSALCGFALADEKSHRYKADEQVVVWYNKVGPYNNPQESYSYDMLPWCKGHKDQTGDHKFAGLGEVLEGNELVNSGLAQFHFGVDVKDAAICSQVVDARSEEELKYAVANRYWYQIYIDDLPLWGMVGEKSPVENEGGKDAEEVASIYTHKKFTVSFNEDRVIEVQLASSKPIPISRGNKLDFTYSVEWKPTDIAFEQRFERYLDYSFFEHQIHWFSIFNSFMMVIFLAGLVTLVLMRTLRSDFARYAKDMDSDLDMESDAVDDFGWKQVQGDVFRPPKALAFFSALYGAGIQLIFLILVTVLVATIGTLYVGRGAIINAFVAIYAITSIIGGYVSGSFYARNGGRMWIRCMIATASLFPGIIFLIGFPLNFVAWSYQSLAALPFGTMIVIVVIWAFVAFPLTLLGTVLGRNWSGTANIPCRVNSIPKPLPQNPWFARPAAVIAAGGLLPFGSIFIEMYFIFTSFWNYKFYYVYGFMLLVLVILIIVSVCVTIVSTYYLLNAEDYRWHWTSFLTSASTAVYVYIYAVFYFFSKTKMTGLFQTSFYFGYSLMFALTLAIMCGAIGYWGASIFVTKIYNNIKSD